MKTQYPIRRLIENDAAELAQLAHDIFKVTYEHKLVGSFEQANFQSYLKKAFTIGQIGEELRDSLVAYYGVFDKTKLIGYVKLNHGEGQSLDKPKDFLEIERFYLDPNYHRKGIGQYMFEFVSDWAMENNCSAIWLRSWERNESAIEFYKKMDLKIVGTTVYKFEESDDLDYVFEKQLK